MSNTFLPCCAKTIAMLAAVVVFPSLELADVTIRERIFYQRMQIQYLFVHFDIVPKQMISVVHMQ